MNYEQLAAEYESEIIEAAREYQPYRVGQVIACYSDPYHGMFMTYGRIEAMEWAERYGSWFYTIATLLGQYIVQPSWQLRATYPDEQRMLFVTIKGGRRD